MTDTVDSTAVVQPPHSQAAHTMPPTLTGVKLLTMHNLNRQMWELSRQLVEQRQQITSLEGGFARVRGQDDTLKDSIGRELKRMESSLQPTIKTVEKLEELVTRRIDASLAPKFAALDHGIDALQTDVNVSMQKLRKFGADLTNANEEICKVNGKICSVIEQYDTKEAKLLGRLDSSEKNRDDFEGRLYGLENKHTDHESDMTGIHQQLSRVVSYVESRTEQLRQRYIQLSSNDETVRALLQQAEKLGSEQQSIRWDIAKLANLHNQNRIFVAGDSLPQPAQHRQSQGVDLQHAVIAPRPQAPPQATTVSEHQAEGGQRESPRPRRRPKPRILDEPPSREEALPSNRPQFILEPRTVEAEAAEEQELPLPRLVPVDADAIVPDQNKREHGLATFAELVLPLVEHEADISHHRNHGDLAGQSSRGLLHEQPLERASASGRAPRARPRSARARKVPRAPSRRKKAVAGSPAAAEAGAAPSRHDHAAATATATAPAITPLKRHVSYEHSRATRQNVAKGRAHVTDDKGSWPVI